MKRTVVLLVISFVTSGLHAQFTGREKVPVPRPNLIDDLKASKQFSRVGQTDPELVEKRKIDREYQKLKSDIKQNLNDLDFGTLDKIRINQNNPALSDFFSNFFSLIFNWDLLSKSPKIASGSDQDNYFNNYSLIDCYVKICEKLKAQGAVLNIDLEDPKIKSIIKNIQESFLKCLSKIGNRVGRNAEAKFEFLNPFKSNLQTALSHLSSDPLQQWKVLLITKNPFFTQYKFTTDNRTFLLSELDLQGRFPELVEQIKIDIQADEAAVQEAKKQEESAQKALSEKQEKFQMLKYIIDMHQESHSEGKDLDKEQSSELISTYVKLLCDPDFVGIYPNKEFTPYLASWKTVIKPTSIRDFTTQDLGELKQVLDRAGAFITRTKDQNMRLSIQGAGDFHNRVKTVLGGLPDLQTMISDYIKTILKLSSTAPGAARSQKVGLHSIKIAETTASKSIRMRYSKPKYEELNEPLISDLIDKKASTQKILDFILNKLTVFDATFPNPGNKFFTSERLQKLENFGRTRFGVKPEELDGEIKKRETDELRQDIVDACSYIFKPGLQALAEELEAEQDTKTKFFVLIYHTFLNPKFFESFITQGTDPFALLLNSIEELDGIMDKMPASPIDVENMSLTITKLQQNLKDSLDNPDLQKSLPTPRGEILKANLRTMLTILLTSSYLKPLKIVLIDQNTFTDNQNAVLSERLRLRITKETQQVSGVQKIKQTITQEAPKPSEVTTSEPAQMPKLLTSPKRVKKPKGKKQTGELKKEEAEASITSPSIVSQEAKTLSDLIDIVLKKGFDLKKMGAADQKNQYILSLKVLIDPTFLTLDTSIQGQINDSLKPVLTGFLSLHMALKNAFPELSKSDYTELQSTVTQCISALTNQKSMPLYDEFKLRVRTVLQNMFLDNSQASRSWINVLLTSNSISKDQFIAATGLRFSPRVYENALELKISASSTEGDAIPKKLPAA